MLPSSIPSLAKKEEALSPKVAKELARLLKVQPMVPREGSGDARDVERAYVARSPLQCRLRAPSLCRCLAALRE